MFRSHLKLNINLEYFYLRHAISTLGNSRHNTLPTIWMICIYHFVERLVCVRIVSETVMTSRLCLALKFPLGEERCTVVDHLQELIRLVRC